MIKSKQQWTQYGRKLGQIFVYYRNHVINVTRFMEKHPGGQQAIKNYTYKDITKIFCNVFPHSKKNQDKLLEFRVGTIAYDDDQEPKKIIQQILKKQKLFTQKKKVYFDQNKLYQNKKKQKKQKKQKSQIQKQLQKQQMEILKYHIKRAIHSQSLLQHDLMDQKKPNVIVPLIFKIKNAFQE